MRSAIAESIVDRAVSAARLGDGALVDLLDTLPAAIYVTDADGRVTHFNQACVALAGRMPVALQDRWCVTWRMYGTNGAPLAHADCPMAVALRERRAIRGAEAVAERPDGSRIAFVPYPTPVFDDAGALVGAVNLLVDMTSARQATAFRDQAARCRRLGSGATDTSVIATLGAMALEYDAKAGELDRAH